MVSMPINEEVLGGVVQSILLSMVTVCINEDVLGGGVRSIVPSVVKTAISMIQRRFD
jgi:hypothetical protein